MRVLKHTSKEALQPFKWRSLPRELLLWSLNLLSLKLSVWSHSLFMLLRAGVGCIEYNKTQTELQWGQGNGYSERFDSFCFNGVKLKETARQGSRQKVSCEDVTATAHFLAYDFPGRQT